MSIPSEEVLTGCHTLIEIYEDPKTEDLKSLALDKLEKVWPKLSGYYAEIKKEIIDKTSDIKIKQKLWKDYFLLNKAAALIGKDEWDPQAVLLDLLNTNVSVDTDYKENEQSQQSPKLPKPIKAN